MYFFYICHSTHTGYSLSPSTEKGKNSRKILKGLDSDWNLLTHAAAGAAGAGAAAAAVLQNLHNY